MDIRVIVDAIDRLAMARADEARIKEAILRRGRQEDFERRADNDKEIEEARKELADCFFESRPR